MSLKPEKEAECRAIRYERLSQRMADNARDNPPLKRNVFIEGRDAYRNWIDALCSANASMPVNPYPVGSTDHSDWGTGFVDAMVWDLQGQYEEH